MEQNLYKRLARTEAMVNLQNLSWLKRFNLLTMLLVRLVMNKRLLTLQELYETSFLI